MSGGSYNYLFTADNIGMRRDDMERMAARIEELAFDSKAAIAAAAILIHLKMADELANKLSSVFYAVEWADSGDWSKADAIREITDYEFS